MLFFIAARAKHTYTVKLLHALLVLLLLFDYRREKGGKQEEGVTVFRQTFS